VWKAQKKLARRERKGVDVCGIIVSGLGPSFSMDITVEEWKIAPTRHDK